MNKLKVLFVTGVLSNMLCTVNLALSAQGPYIVIPAASPEQCVEIRALLKTTAQHILHKERGRCFHCDARELIALDKPGVLWYKVDLNNDGILEYVCCYRDGVGNFSITVAQRSSDGRLIFIDLPEKLPYNCFPIWHVPFENEVTQQLELFVVVKGTVYMCMKNRFDSWWAWSYSRDIFLWKGYGITNCCDTFWTSQQRLHFQMLYDRGDYWKAYTLLHHFEIWFRNKLDRTIDFWMRSDIALSALRAGYPNKSLEILRLLEHDLPQNASSRLRKAISHNRTLAQRASDEEGKSVCSYDFRWLLEYEGKENSILIQDLRIASLLKATVPDILGPYSNDYEREDPWRNRAKLSLTGAGGPCSVVQGRYVMFWGRNPQIEVIISFIWCDVEAKVSVLGYGVNDYPESPMQVYLTSRTLLAHELPQEFYRALRTWLSDAHAIRDSEFIFCDRLGRRHHLTIPKEKEGPVSSPLLGVSLIA